MTACPFHGASPGAAAPSPAVDAPPLDPSPLLDPDFRMRPPGEPLPPPLRAHGGTLADVFARWLRQRDDAAHAVEKTFLTRALQALSDDDIRSHARRQAAIAWQGDWPHWSWAVPAATVASLLGLPIDDLAAQQRLHAALRAMAGGLGASADGDAVRAADTAVEHLLHALDDAERRSPDAPLQWTLLRHAPPARWSDRAAFAANRMALIWQSHEAGASLLGHALLAMKTGGGVPTRETLWHIARDGGAVRDTRRFDHRRPGGTPVVVPLAGTDHPFGDGAHRCPGQGLTLTALHAALGWLADRPDLRLPDADTPLSLPNMDIPRFHPARAIDQETQP